MAAQDLLKWLYGVWRSMKRRADAEVSPDHEKTAGQRWTHTREQHLTTPNQQYALERERCGREMIRQETHGYIFYHENFL